TLPWREINPTAIYAYHDKVQIWLQQPLSRKEVDWLRSQCGFVHEHNEVASFDRSLRKRLQLHQPSHAAIQSLCTVKGVYANYGEWALDWIFDTEDEREQAYAVVCQYHVKKRHRLKTGIRFVGEGDVTRYTGPRRSRNNAVIYSDRPSKVT